MNLTDLYIEKNKHEQMLLDRGYKYIAGVDEVGRGPLAGPVTIGAVILDPQNPIYGLKDSKKLSKKQIAKLAVEIKEKAISYAVVSSTAQTIDKIGISVAIKMCMRKAIYRLEQKPDFILIDYQDLNFKNIESMAIIKGDDNSNSIAAASIIAKDARDNFMIRTSKKYPHYDFESNVGYGTKAHLEALDKYGPVSGIHRYTFKPIRKD